MLKRPYPAKAMFRRNRYGAAGVMLSVLTLLVPLGAWTAQRSPVSPLRPHPVLHTTRHLDLTGAVTSAIQGMCLTEYAAHSGHGGVIAAVARCKHLSSQRWTLPGDNTIRNRGECLTVTNKSNATGAVLVTCDGTARQYWEADGIVGVPAIELLNPWSGECLDDPHGSKADSTQVRIYACNRSSEQIWYLPGW